jgi:hypothetical protein
VSGLRAVAAPPRARVQAALGGLLAELPDPLHLVVEQIGGEGGEIDAIARDAEGRAVAVSVAASGEDLARLADLAAQCEWLGPRLRDWLKLNPGLGLAPELGVRGLLLADEFDPRTLSAARRIGSSVALARIRAFEWQGGLQLTLEPVGSPGRAPRPERGAAAPPPTPTPSLRGEELREVAPRLVLAEVGPEIAALESRFRTALRDDELGLPRRPRGAPRG